MYKFMLKRCIYFLHSIKKDKVIFELVLSLLKQYLLFFIFTYLKVPKRTELVTIVVNTYKSYIIRSL